MDDRMGGWFSAIAGETHSLFLRGPLGDVAEARLSLHWGIDADLGEWLLVQGGAPQVATVHFAEPARLYLYVRILHTNGTVGHFGVPLVVGQAFPVSFATGAGWPLVDAREDPCNEPSSPIDLEMPHPAWTRIAIPPAPNLDSAYSILGFRTNIPAPPNDVAFGFCNGFETLVAGPQFEWNATATLPTHLVVLSLAEGTWLDLEMYWVSESRYE